MSEEDEAQSAPLPVMIEARMQALEGTCWTMFAGILNAQTAILLGIVDVGMVDRVRLREWLQRVIDDLTPPQRATIYGECLRHHVWAKAYLDCKARHAALVDRVK